VNETVGDGRFVVLPGPPRGRGAGGEVYKALDLENDGQLVAVKLIAGHPDDPLAKTYFEREVSTLNRLTHPNVVDLIYAGLDEDRRQYYVVLEWMDENLEEVLANKPWRTWDEFAESVYVPLVDALAYAHLQQIQHRDIKPSNILMSAGVPKLADFGIAKLADILDPSGRTVFGAHTPPYMPPDLGAEAPYTPDVWALAVVALEAMQQSRIRDLPGIDLALDGPGIPSEVRVLLANCLDLDVTVRPRDGAVFRQELMVIQNARRARHGRRETALWLELRDKPREVIGQDSDARDVDAEQFVALELSEQWSAEYRRDPETNQIDRHTIFIFGRRWRFVARLDTGRSAFVIVKAQKDSAIQHKRACDQACDMSGRVDIDFGRPTPQRAQAAERIMLSRLDEHHEPAGSSVRSTTAAREGTQLLDRLLNLLDAREEVARGDRQPLRYSSRRVRGIEIEFGLAATTDEQLIGEEWDLRLPPSRRIGRGTVVRQTSRTVSIRFHRLLRNIPERAELVPNLGPTQVAHDRQVEATRRINAGTALRPDLKALLADPSSIRKPVSSEPEFWVQEDLDDGKKSAVSAALGFSDFLLVEGPPGTGKTSFIAETVSQYLRRKPETKVLIVSQTHVAVDNALERLAGVSAERIVRLGAPDDPRVSPQIQPLLLDRQMKQWAGDIRARAEAFAGRIAAEYSLLPRHLTAALKLEQLATVVRDIDHVLEESARVENDERDERTVTGLEQVQDYVAIEDRLQSLQDIRSSLLEALRPDLDGDLTLPLQPSVEEIRAAVGALMGHTQVPANVMNVLRLQGEWFQRIENDQKLASAYLQTARVIAGTCVGFLGYSAVRDLEFDLCVLDEASKATATEALVPLARSKKWILVGDRNQLPPMDEELLRSSEVMRRYELDSDFVRTTLFDRLLAGTEAPIKTRLTSQYRMIRPIGDLISKCFYDETLRSPKTDSLEGMDQLTRPVLWLDTSRSGSARFEESAIEGTSQLNRLEAKSAVDRLQVFERGVERGLLKLDGSHPLSVLMMAPYARQVEEIERQLATFQFRHLDVVVNSVDAMQGREADIAIFSVTRNNASGRLGFLGEEYWRRINVALSRARYSLTIVGGLEFCVAHPGALREVGMYMKSHPDDCEIRSVDLA
jgi:hypothetical protein